MRGSQSNWKRCASREITDRHTHHRPATVATNRTGVRGFWNNVNSSTSPTTTMIVQRAAGDMPRRGSSSSVMYIEHSVGMIVSATNSDDASVMISVLGRKPMNSPTIPGQNISGAKAANVVAVEPITGSATSAVAFFAAHTRSQPSSR